MRKLSSPESSMLKPATPNLSIPDTPLMPQALAKRQMSVAPQISISVAPPTPVILTLSLSKGRNPCISLLLLLVLLLAPALNAQKTTIQFSGQSAYNLTKQLLDIAPKRFNGSPGHAKAEEFIKQHFAPEAAKGNLETDTFTASTPAGLQTMHNYIVRFPGKKDGIIVLATHYET